MSAAPPSRSCRRRCSRVGRSPGCAPISFLRRLRARSRSRCVALGLWALPPLIAWATTQAVWSAPDGALCRAHQDGACWAFIAQKLDYLSYGSYPVAERWRVDAVEIVGAALIAWMLWPGAPRRGLGAALFFLIFPILAFVLLHGAASFGLPRRRHFAVGRGVRLVADRARRHRVLAAARRAAGAGAPLAICPSSGL